MASVRIQSSPLKGSVLAQPSKSMAHRAVICAALANGKSIIDNVVLSDDITATIGAVRALGADVTLEDSSEYKGRKKLLIESRGRVSIENKTIDCLESGSTARFIIPLTRLSPDSVTLTGHGRLVERPFGIYAEMFRKNGVQYTDNGGKMPITLSGKLVSGEFLLPGDVSSQFVSGLLLALPMSEGPSKINITTKLESLPYVKMTLDVLKNFGIKVSYDESYQHFEIEGGQSYQPIQNYIVEGDWSQAAFFCVMGAISDNITVKGLNLDSVQGDKEILDILNRMGANYQVNENGITFNASKLKGIDIDVSQCPDLVPAIAVAASIAEGKAHIKNAARLRIKESDRLTTTRHELCALGAEITEEPDGLIFQGVSHFSGEKTNGSGDHRIVMAIAAASSACNGNIEIEGSDAVKKSYPEFWDDFIALGGRIESI